MFFPVPNFITSVGFVTIFIGFVYLASIFIIVPKAYVPAFGVVTLIVSSGVIDSTNFTTESDATSFPVISLKTVLNS